MDMSNSTRLIFVAAICLLSIELYGQGISKDDSPWAIANLKKIIYGKKGDVGIMLFTVSDDVPGAAFRCERRRLYVFLSMKSVEMLDAAFRPARNPRAWKVWYSIDGGEETEEEWVSFRSGHMMIVRPKPTTLAIYDAAKVGTTITVRPQNAKAVTIELPPDTTGIFDRFWDRCGFGAVAAVELAGEREHYYNQQ